MNIQFLKRTFLCALLFCAIGSKPSLAFDQCTENAIDPDGDGWGWESGESCRFGESMPPLPDCQLTGSDPDGDGWGWENDASCKTRTTEEVVPGINHATALPIECDSNINATMEVNRYRHYFRIDIPESTSFLLDAGDN